jgi:spore coat assembly protein
MVIKEIKPGDVVARSSYSGDILFRVEKVVKDKHQQSALLRGMFVRLYASAPLHDLEKKNDNEVVQVKSDFLRKKQSYIRRALKRQSRTRKIPINTGSRSSSDFFELPGKVLHLEGDRMYCDRCLKTYLRLAVPCQVVHIPEWEQPDAVVKYLKENRPDILVLTGHDAVKKGVQDYLNMDYYRNSKHFIDAVARAQEFEANKDDLIIVAGGCQSHFEALIDAGANFASAPGRIMIDVLDPVFIAERLAYASIYEKISLLDILEQAEMGIEGIGGVQTRGKMRLGLPRPQY